jgi:drug/metabolite transporter (DMT)-like permease
VIQAPCSSVLLKKIVLPQKGHIMEWIVFALLGAVASAVGNAVNKKMLKADELISVIGFASFTVAGLLFIGAMLLSSTPFPVSITSTFVLWILIGAVLNALGMWFFYKALRSAEFGYLMPFMVVTSLSVIIPPWIILGEVPSLLGWLGIALVVVGAFVMNRTNDSNVVDHARKDTNRRGLMYFLVTAVCFSITPTTLKVTIQETSAIFAGGVLQLLVGMCFFFVAYVRGEFGKIRSMLNGATHARLGLFWAGAFKFLEECGMSIALATAPVALAMGIKRTMPIFAFLIAYCYFKERTDTAQKLQATVLMVAGAVLVVVST